MICTIELTQLCAGFTGTESHDRDGSALRADRAAAPWATGPAGLAAAAGSHGGRLRGGERAGERPAATEHGLAGAAGHRRAVHARLVRGAAAAHRPQRALPADHHRGVRLPVGALAAADRVRMAHAALRTGHHLAAADSGGGAGAGDLADRGQRSRGEGGARLVERHQRDARDPADRRRSAAVVCAVSPEHLTEPRVHVHILGIGGTFMGGVAAIARAAGWRVTGSDRDMYPPMSTQLEALGIEVTAGFGAEQLELRPDVVVVGNVMTRGMPVVEALLESGRPYLSGPEWLSREVLKDRWVLAVAGTHGKTTTASILAWILEHAGLDPGFLIGGVAANFTASARLGSAPFFVIEADEYDTAFFDKRAKFVHYRPRTAVLNNLEYDHADIYPDVESIQRQFHHLVRIVPGGGRIVWNASDARLEQTLAMGCWTPCEGFARSEAKAPDALWTARPTGGVTDFSQFEVLE